MPSLEDLIKAKSPTAAEQNLESGSVYSFAEGGSYMKFCKCWCWVSCGSGTVRLELWGAGGSGAKMCCCGFGLPGNSGAYTRKDFTVESGCYICGCNGFACGNSDTMCFRGCGEPTNACWFGNGTSSCLCAQGGKGGVSICSTTPSGYCCFRANGACATNTGPQCGIICNYGTGSNFSWIPSAYNGDVNKQGNISCIHFMGCYPSCICQMRVSVAGPPGSISEDGVIAAYGMDTDNAYSNWSGMMQPGAIAAINGSGRTPGMGIQWMACWRGFVSCGCYNQSGCYSKVPYGWGGAGSTPCPSVRDHGHRGGHGATRIRFIET